MSDSLKRSHSCGLLTKEAAGEQVVLCGWVAKRRDHGGLIFVDLRDRSGIVQIVVDPDDAGNSFTTAEAIRSEYVIKVAGKVRLRDAATVNPNLATGEIEVVAADLEVLNAAKTPPFYIQDDIDKTFTEAYTALERANIELGIQNVEIFAFNVPLEHDVKIKSRSIMGTEIPHVKYVPDPGQPTYSFSTTRESIDKAREAFRKVKELTIRLSMIENAAYRLASNIKKTQKRANALQNITIPMYENLVYTISNALEEKEREEFTRLKVIKQMKEKKEKK